jgi:hypothetical protein
MSTEPVVILFPDEIAAWLASAPPATCPICRESFSDRDITTCDECGTTLCVHCHPSRPRHAAPRSRALHRRARRAPGPVTAAPTRVGRDTRHHEKPTRRRLTAINRGER